MRCKCRFDKKILRQPIKNGNFDSEYANQYRSKNRFSCRSDWLCGRTPDSVSAGMRVIVSGPWAGPRPNLNPGTGRPILTWRLFTATRLTPNLYIRLQTDVLRAFYLVHSMNPSVKNFEEADRQSAKNMACAAQKAGLERIVYLGGLGDAEHGRLSKHLKSRHETADLLRSGTVPVTFLRAAMIIGSGSASFEIMRYLVERLPVMITPRWVNTENQPISIRNVLVYLKACLETDAVLGGTFDIGGPDILTYRDLFDIYAEEAGLPKRWIIPIPFLTPGLSSFWIHLITPVPAYIAMPLAEGLKNKVICKDDRILSIVSQELIGCREAIRYALQRIREEATPTCWSDAGCLLPPEWVYCGDVEYSGGTILECGYRIRIEARPETIWKTVIRIGGKTGWYFGDKLWELRGILDKIIGGIGLSRGRRNPFQVGVGDALDFWRVLEMEENERLMLLAEMKTPGDALLQFEIHPIDSHISELEILSRFLPKGILGLAYWYAFVPVSSMDFHRYAQIHRRSNGRVGVAKPRTFHAENPGRLQDTVLRLLLHHCTKKNRGTYQTFPDKRRKSWKIIRLNFFSDRRAADTSAGPIENSSVSRFVRGC